VQFICFSYNDNPGEELNRFPEEFAGYSWGYPYCWSEYLLPAHVSRGRGSVWSWPGTDYTDEECQMFKQSELSMQAHSAPLGIVFYEWLEDRPRNCTGAFPQSMDGFAFIAFHGSWNRDIPTGYKVVYVPFHGNGTVAAEPIDLLAHVPPNAKWESGFRPVDLDFDDCGRLVITSDGTRDVGGANIIRVELGESAPSSAHSYFSSKIPDLIPGTMTIVEIIKYPLVWSIILTCYSVLWF